VTRRLHRAALALAVVTTAIAIGLLAPRLRAAPVALVHPEHPWVRLDREMTEDFGMPIPVVWVLEARHGTIWSRDALARLHAATRAVLEIPGVLPTEVLSLASPNLRDLRATDDSLEPVYLMAEVPATEAAVAALRERVEQDPMLHGQLVSRDGRAALIVASIDPAADLAEVARAALALRERIQDATVAVWVVGAPVVAATTMGAAPAIARQALVALATGALLGGAVLGLRATLAAATAAALAALWGLLLAVVGGLVLWPWSGFGLLPGIVLAAASATGRNTPWRAAAALAAGGGVLGLLVGPPASALGWTMTLSALAALPAGWLATAATAAGPDTTSPAHTTRDRLPPRVRRTLAVGGCVVLLALGAAGAAGLRPAFGLAGYASRWLPRGVTADLHALERLVPPPTSLAVRLRGPSGFMAEPAVLQALDAATSAVRTDPAVASALSLADLVALVHRAFAGDDAVTRLPADRGLVARYLALAYSPGFRRFLDRALEQTALWVQVRGERPADLERVHRQLAAALLAAPPAGTTVDLLGGDGAVVLVAAGMARRLALATIVLLAIVTGLGATAEGMQGAWRIVASGGAALATSAGILALVGLELDLFTVPALGTLAAASAACALSPPRHPAARERSTLALAVAAIPLLVAPLAPLRLLAALLAGLAAAGAVARR